MSILYVDDEPAVSMIVEHTLRDAGHETVGARNVPEALQVLARGGVELIISDYRMPGLSGLEFLELLTSEGFDIPLIMLTGYASIEHAVASIKAGAVDYITKPVRPEQLTLAVEQALELVRLRKENATLRTRDERSAERAADSGGQRGDAARAAIGRHRRAHPRHRSPARRIGHGEGTVRARDPRHERPPRQAVHQAELRGAARGADRERAVRPREGCVHRRDQAGRGRIRAREPRHAASRRNIRDASRSAGEAAARAAGAGVRARGRHEHDSRRRARDRDIEPRSRRPTQRRAASGRICISA